VQALTELLAHDVVVWADGGGKVSAARRPVSGQEKVTRFVQGLLRKALADLTVSVETINGGPALLFWTGATLFTVGGFRIADGQIHGIYAILNPDKLAYLQRQLRKRHHTRSVAP
jgi:RNA polymerase sigma-70 factor (ECF subfamily)